MRLPLKHHRDLGCAAVERLDVECARAPGGVLELRYALTGRIADLCLPAPASPARSDGLWAHTCFEAFVRGGGDDYYEFNFAPSSQWAAYRFDAYRAGMSVACEIPPPSMQAISAEAGFELRATVTLGDFAGAWRVALSAVIEEASGAKSYWALAHPPGKADFHHADGFVLELPERT